MEQHPVPQNVTTFQFRLIGDMTLKQFGYLAAGAILAYVSYKLPLPFIVTWPLAVTFALLGFGFAFVPVEERPMDVWVFSFFKSIYSPTQYMWQKGQQGSQPPAASRQTQQTGTQIPAPTQTTQAPQATPPAGGATTSSVVAQLYARRADAKIHTMSTPSAGGPFAWLTQMLSSFRMPGAASLPPATPTSYGQTPMVGGTPQRVTGTHLDLPAASQPAPAVAPAPPQAGEPSEAQSKLEEQIQRLTQELSTKESGETRILELQKQLTDVMAEKNKMEKELLATRQRQTRPFGASPFGTPSPFTPARSATPSVAGGSPAQPSAASHTVQQTTPAGPTVRVIAGQEQATRAGLPRLTSVPNIVTGITKDNQGNLLPGVLITVRDHDEVPLRALKTNKLGQFAASTPLPNATYFIEVEDPRSRYTFDRAQVTLTGAVLPALEITAKSQKELSRDKLAQQIFGDQKI
jgi:hypothetical protein